MRDWATGGRARLHSAAAAGLFFGVCCALAGVAAAYTDTASNLDVGSGEDYSISGVHTYTTGVNIHDGGHLGTGGGALTLIAPGVTITAGSYITGSQFAGDGLPLTIICDRLNVAGAIYSDGSAGTLAAPPGRNGGAITIRADRTVDVAGAITANGGAGYTSPTGSGGYGGAGGSILVTAPAVNLSVAGDRVAANGGAGGVANNGGQGGLGGGGGQVRVQVGRFTRPGNVAARAGGGGAAHGYNSTGGSGGNGGTIAVRYGSKSGAGSLDVAGGTHGFGDYFDGTDGLPGSASETIAVTVPFGMTPTIDGVPNASEWADAWTWDMPGNYGNTAVWMLEDGHALFVAMQVAYRGYGYYDEITLAQPMFDKNHNGGTIPQTDDLQIWRAGDDYYGYANGEAAGTGTSWSSVTPSGGWTVALGGGANTMIEFRVPYSKLGLTAGVARTLRVALDTNQKQTFSTPYKWPGSMSTTQPVTWPDMDSIDAWTSSGNTPPGGWDSFAPSGWTTGAPVCMVKVQDAGDGLDAGSGQYRYSKDDGTTWSAWSAAAVAGANGTTAQTTVTASRVPFNATSETQHRIQFKVFDVGGMESVLCPQYIVKTDSTAPAGWGGFAPSSDVTETLTPTCTVQVRDTASGLDPASARYAYSTNGGTSWSAWLAAGCTGAAGAITTQTLTAGWVPFGQASTTQDKIRFRVADIVGNASTSTTFNVRIAAPLEGLPRNGDFEVGSVATQPGLWVMSKESTYTYWPIYQGGSPLLPVHSASVTTQAAFRGSKAAYGHAENAFTIPFWVLMSQVDTTLMASAADDFSGIGEVELKMRDTTTSIACPGNPWTARGWVSLAFNDGSHPATEVALYSCRIEGYFPTGTYVTDTAIGPVTGSDGKAWSLYRVAIPAGLDKARLKVGVHWRGRADGELAYPDLRISGYVDGLRAVDIVPPSSSASAGGSVWRYDSAVSAPYVATDNAGLAEVGLWYRRDSGAGWSDWTGDQTATASGRSASGTFTFNAPGDGLYRLASRARDATGNLEALPATADTTVGVDRQQPAGWGSFSPAGWATARTVTCTMSVTETGSGMGLAPVAIGRADAHVDTIGRVDYASDRVYAAEPSSLSIYDVSHPRTPAFVGAAKLDDLRDVAYAGPGLVYAAQGAKGFCAIDVADPEFPEALGALDLGGTAVGMALGPVGYAYVALGDGPVIRVVDVRDPAAPRLAGSSDTLPDACTDIATDGTYVYATLANGQLAVLSSTLRSPARVAGRVVAQVASTLKKEALVDLPAVGRGVAARGGYVYVADGGDGLQIVDVTRGPRSAKLVGHSGVDGVADDVCANGPRVYVAREDGALAVVNVANGANPALAATVDTAGSSLGICGSGHHVYLGDGTNGLVVCAVAEPAYQYSTDGGTTWSDWLAATGASQGQTGTVTLTAPAVPFGQDSATQDKIRFRVGDAVGSAGSSADQTVLVDAAAPAAPVVTSATHSDPNTWYPASTATLDWSAPSDVSGIAGYSVVLDDTSGTVPPAAINTTALTTTTAGVPEGVHYLHIRARDVAGNWGAERHFRYRVDFTPPAAPIGLAMSPPEWSTRTTFTAGWTNPAQTFAPLAARYYKLDAPPASPTDGTRVPGAAASLADVPATTEGTHTVYLWLEDAAGNKTQANRVQADFYSDRSAPSAVTLDSPTHPDPDAWSNDNDPRFTFTAADGVSGVRGYSYVLDHDPETTPDATPEVAATSVVLTDTPDGDWYFHVRAVDAAVNCGPTAVRRIRIDTGPPFGSFAVDGGAAWTNSVRATVDSSINDAVEMGVTGDIQGSQPASSAYAPSVSITLTAGDGTKNVNVRYVDGPGNTLDTADSIGLDTGAPTPPLPLSPSHTIWVASADPTVDVIFSGATDSLSGVAGFSVSWTKDAAAVPAGTQDLDASAIATTSPRLADGAWYFNILALDDAGNAGPAAHLGPFVIDTRPVTALTLSGPASALFGQSVALAGSLSSPGGPVSGRAVTLWRKAYPAGASWTLVGLATYDAATARYRASCACTANTLFEMRFAGDTSYKGSTSSDVLARVGAYLPKPVAPSVVRRGASFTTYGYLKPRHTGSTKLYFYRKVGHRWVKYRVVGARNAAYSTYTKYSVRYRLPYAGAWRVRAYHADADHAATWSPIKSFTVR
jgi:hypothetical protein